MEYNTEREHLIIPEYGRHVQTMINHATAITDKVEQQKCVDAIIAFMGQMNPHLRDVKEFTHKLWDQLHIMSDFKLEIESPYKKPAIEKLAERPEKMIYPGNKIKFSYYGNTVQTMIDSAIKMEGDEKELETLLTSMERLTKKQTLDIFSCVECGRCTEVCPANRGGGILDPKHNFILDLKTSIMETKDVNVINNIDVEAGWECTSCQACTEACPVGNEVEKADEIRNLQVLVEGNVPQEYQKLFMNLQTTGNTEGATTSALSERLPIYDGSQQFVLWLGCFSKYALDPKYGDSVMNLTKILDRANITYGILSKEKCTGEPANKLGDKLTYNMLMKENIENLKQVKKIITMCPHCSINLGTEYAKYEKIEYEVFHHTQIIEDLIKNKKITVNKNNNDKVTFHDPCNLSRGMNEVSAPRTAINASCSNFNELEENGKNTLCCGAGGGLWWKKETKGRAHLVRAEQVIKSGNDTVVTGCSFCYGMMNQGLGPLTPQGQKQIKVKDIADIVAENLS